MLSINKAYFWIFIYLMFAQILSLVFFKSADELSVMFMFIIIALDLAINRNFKRYKGLYLVVGIMSFYAIYSMTALKFNIKSAIIKDFIIELKPFVAFFIGYAFAPRFTTKQKQILKGISLSLLVVLIIILATGLTKEVLFHIACFGSITFILFLVYLLCSVKKDGTISRNDLLTGIFILAIGLLCTRSKYYGEAVMALFMLTLYKPGTFRKISYKQVLIALCVVGAVIAVAWSKISYYFLTGNSDTIDVDTIQTFARPALYGGMFLILLDYPLLGSGLASFATYASSPSVNYSLVYAKYDLNLVFGLSEQYYEFICDAFYATMAQYGLIGICLFIYFFVWIFQKLRLVLHTEGKYVFAVGVLVITYVLIENVGGTFFTQSGGLMSMIILGQITGKYRTTTKAEKETILNSDYPNNNDNNK